VGSEMCIRDRWSTARAQWIFLPMSISRYFVNNFTMILKKKSPYFNTAVKVFAVFMVVSLILSLFLPFFY